MIADISMKFDYINRFSDQLCFIITKLPKCALTEHSHVTGKSASDLERCVRDHSFERQGHFYIHDTLCSDIVLINFINHHYN